MADESGLSREKCTDQAIRTLNAQGSAVSLGDVVKLRVFRQFSAAIERYLVLRVGHVASAREALQTLRDAVASASDEELASSPSVHAHLLKMARATAIAVRERYELDVVAMRRKLPWAIDAYATESGPVLAFVRGELDEADLELVELRCIHRLSSEEAASVVGMSVEEVTRRTDAALAVVNAKLPIVGGIARTLLGVLDDALALDLAEPEGKLAEQSGLFTGVILDGRYRLDKRVGEGAFGEVYRATDTHVPGHVVALKLLHEPATTDAKRTAALRELHLLASVFHPSIVQLKDHGWHEGRLWFVMPWYDGESLESRLRRAPLERAAAHRIFTSLARALAAMHAVGIRHQDVKPENVLLARIKTSATDSELPVLLDLGVAAKEAEILIAGTPTYFAPEVAARFAGVADAPRIGPKADIFSLALALRNALDPALEESIGESVDVFIAHRALRSPPAPTSRDLAYLGSHFARWLDVDPARRPDANTFADELDILLAPERSRARRRAVATFLVPLLAVVFGAAAAFGYIGLREVLQQRRAAAHASAHAHTLEAELGSTRAERSQVDRQLARAESQLEAGRLSQSELEDTVGVVRRSLESERDRAEQSERGRRAEAAHRADAEAERDRAQARAWRSAQSLLTREAELDRARILTRNLRTQITLLSRDLARARADAESSRIAATGAESRARAAQRSLDDARRRLAEMERARGR